MAEELTLPLGVSLSVDIEERPSRAAPFRARVRWIDPATKGRTSKSASFATREAAIDWAARMERAAAHGVDPKTATTTLAEYGTTNMALALRGLESKTTDPYLAGWRKRVVPTLGHLPIAMVTNGAVDRAVHAWIADECSRSTVKNSLAVLVRIMEQALRDGIIDRNPAESPVGNANTSSPRTNSTIHGHLRSRTGLPSPPSPMHSSPGRRAVIGVGVTQSSSRRARPPASAKWPDAWCATSTPTSGYGRYAVRPPHRRVAWWTRTLRANVRAKSR